MKIFFSSIKNGTIFNNDFLTLPQRKGTIEFKHLNASGGIAVVYAPNGTGKSSLSKVLETENTSPTKYFSAVNDNGMNICPESCAFHVIQDQINRNVIHGKETDYLVGQQIRREYELRDRINNAFETAYRSLGAKYKDVYKVSKVGDYLLNYINTFGEETYIEAYGFIRSIVNTRSHGRDIDQTSFVSYIINADNEPNTYELNPEKRTWIINDANNAKIAARIIDIDHNRIIPNENTTEIEKHDDAIGILRKYHAMSTCIVCDNLNYNGNELLERKTNNLRRIYDSLDQSTRDILDKIVRDRSLIIDDPFDIKRIVSAFISGDEIDTFQNLQHELKSYFLEICNEMVKELFHCFDNAFFQDYTEYNRLVMTQPSLDNEELLFIQDIINENIGKNITIERDPESRNYKLKLGNINLIGTDRNSIELSSGEQNFISLSFELLLARHSQKEYVVLDDPISSFDSIYKNKIAYCIIKFLENKKQIVLTHNIDLIRLLDVQCNNCFNLYILNNVENGENGFIPVNDMEKNMLINLHALIQFFQNKEDHLVQTINNKRLFLMSMIPFMRGYSHILYTPEDDIFGRLSGIMHGYGTGSVNVVPIYKKLFGYDFVDPEIISVTDILNVDINNLDIMLDDSYPLLKDTLKQTLIYYYLRMKVEKELVDIFGLRTREMDKLNQIIMRAFRCDDINDPDFEQKRAFRVFFTSRKTLLNEFNHFEGNMNIFQPAIDITQYALRKEINDIERKLIEVRNYAMTQE